MIASFIFCFLFFVWYIMLLCVLKFFGKSSITKNEILLRVCVKELCSAREMVWKYHQYYNTLNSNSGETRKKKHYWVSNLLVGFYKHQGPTQGWVVFNSRVCSKHRYKNTFTNMKCSLCADHWYRDCGIIFQRYKLLYHVLTIWLQTKYKIFKICLI